MRVRYTAQARADLEQIADWIAQDDLLAAAAFVGTLRTACESLSAHAQRYPVAFSLAGNEIRKMSRGRYLTFYRVAEDGVQILRIGHGARDWSALFEDEA